MATRSTRNRPQNQNALPLGQKKRPREDTLVPQAAQKKKCVFGDITNRENNKALPQKKGLKAPAAKPTKGKTLVAVPKTKKAKVTSKPKSENGEDLPLSQQSTKSEDLSFDILELSQESKSSQSSNASVEENVDVYAPQLVLSAGARKFLSETKEPIDDIDKEHLGDPYQVAMYAPFIFNYYKQREDRFVISDYMPAQKDLTTQMRAILVDWLVEVQENFELNHETLYLAIKLVDLYLHKHNMSKDQLQLVGATALFIACKFDERVPPVLDDFLYICDDAYQREELLEMERQVLRAVDFDLGMPLSYRYLRRYSKCARSQITTLTLARYILETSQMEYKFVRSSDSLRGAACLLLAMKMDNSGSWTPTLVHYSGHTEQELLPMVRELNDMLSAAPNSKLTTIRVKYSHRVFHEVAKVPALDVLELASSQPGSS